MANDRKFSLGRLDLTSPDVDSDRNPTAYMLFDEATDMIEFYNSGDQKAAKKLKAQNIVSQDPNDDTLNPPVVEMQDSVTWFVLDAAGAADIDTPKNIVAASGENGYAIKSVGMYVVEGDNAFSAGGANPLLVQDDAGSTLVDLGIVAETGGKYFGQPAVAFAATTSKIDISAATAWSGGDGATPGYIVIGINYTTVNPG